MLLYILIIEIFRNSFKAFPVTIIVAMIVIALSVLMSIVVYLTIFFSRIRAANIYIKTTRVRALISYKLNQYLFFMEGVSQVTWGDMVDAGVIDCIINLPTKLFLDTQIPACLLI